MKKSLVLVSSFTLFGIPIPNLYISTIKTNNINQLNSISTSNETEIQQLKDWHNSLTIEQDKEAKKDYIDSMIIKTSKSSNNSDFDTYSISFDKDKLKNMLNNGLLNQYAYDVVTSNDCASRLTSEANAVVTLPESENKTINVQPKIRAFQECFYISDNKFHFVDSNNPNPEAINLKSFYATNEKTEYSDIDFFEVIDDWFEFGAITITQKDKLIDKMMTWFEDDLSEEAIIKLLKVNVKYLIPGDTEIMSVLLYYLEGLLTRIIPAALKEVNNNRDTTNSNYALYSDIVNNFDKIKAANEKYNMGVAEDFYLSGSTLSMDPNSIRGLGPIEANGNNKTDVYGSVYGPKWHEEYTEWDYPIIKLIDYSDYYDWNDFISQHSKAWFTNLEISSGVFTGHNYKYDINGSWTKDNPQILSKIDFNYPLNINNYYYENFIEEQEADITGMFVNDTTHKMILLELTFFEFAQNSYWSSRNDFIFTNIVYN